MNCSLLSKTSHPLGFLGLHSRARVRETRPTALALRKTYSRVLYSFSAWHVLSRSKMALVIDEWRLVQSTCARLCRTVPVERV